MRVARNDCQLKELLTVKQIIIVSNLENVEKTALI